MMMKQATIWKWLVLASLVLAVSIAHGRQDEFESYWNELQSAVERNDFPLIKRMVQNHPDFASRAYWQAADQFVIYELRAEAALKEKSRKTLEQIGNAHYILDNNQDFAKYLQFLLAMDLGRKQTWTETFGKYTDFMIAYYGAIATKEDLADDRAALAKYEEVATEFEQVGDYYNQGVVMNTAGVLLAQIKDIESAQKAFDIALACFRTFGSEKQEREVKTRIGELDIVRRTVEYEEKLKEDARAEAGITKEGETPWQKIEMTYRVDPRGLEATTHPYTADDYLLWHRVTIGEDPVDFYESFEQQAAMWTAYYRQAMNREPRTESLLADLKLVNDKNKIFIDYNDDGKNQSEERLKASASPSVVELGPLHTPEGEPIEYAMEMVLMGQETFFGFQGVQFFSDTTRQIAYRRACHREGEYKQKKILLVDDNSNGSYDDFGADSLFVEGETPCFLGKLNRLGGEIVEVRVPDKAGRQVNIRPYEGPVGKVSATWKGPVKPEFLLIRGVEGEVLNAIFALDLKEPITVPVGTYTFYFGTIRSGKGRQIETVEIREGAFKDFEVKEGETHEITLGSPFEYEFKLSEDPENYIIRGRDLSLHGASGELYTRYYWQFPYPKIQVRRKGGGVVAKGSMRKVEYEDRRNDPEAVWFPKDFEIEKKKAGKDPELMVRFNAEAKLLGKIDSDFKPPQ